MHTSENSCELPELGTLNSLSKLGVMFAHIAPNKGHIIKYRLITIYDQILPFEGMMSQIISWIKFQANFI